MIPWGTPQQIAFDKLKQLLINAVEKPLQIIDPAKPYHIHVDASDYPVGAVLGQPGDQGSEQPIAFASKKLNATQRNWATVEKETFAILWSLQKYRHWLFGADIIVYSDHNPVTYLTEAASKSAKVMRWALAIQEYNVKFVYKAGRTNVAADCLSRLVPAGVEELNSG